MQKLSQEDFIEKAKKINPDNDYSLTNYVNAHTKVEIICKLHGSFSCLPYCFMKSSGKCPKCVIIQRAETKSQNHREKILTNIKVLEDRYKITLKEEFDRMYSSKKQLKKYLFSCNNCGYEWKQGIRWNRDLSCPICHPINHGSSKGELELYNYFLTTGLKILHNDRKILSGKELDIYIPEKNIAIEYDGEYWHDKNKDFEKEELCKQKGITLIRVKDSDWRKDYKEVLNRFKDFSFSEIKEIKTSSNKCRRIICLDTNEIFENYHEAMQKFNIKYAPSLLNVCNGRFKSIKGLHFCYL